MFSKDLKEGCINYIPKAQARHILTQSVPVALQNHDISFHFTKDGTEYLFSTYNKFGGHTSEFSFNEKSGLKGEATTKFTGRVTIKGQDVLKTDDVNFYVNIISNFSLDLFLGMRRIMIMDILNLRAMLLCISMTY
jgi:hypothetical protein